MRRRELLIGGASLSGLWACRTAGTPVCPEPAAASPAPASAPAPDAGFPELAGFCDGIPAVSAEEREERRRRAQAAMVAADVGALILEAGENHGYFAPTSWGQSERPLLMVLPRAGAPIWVGPAFEARTLGELLGDVELLVWQEDESPYARAREALRARDVPKSAALAVDPLMRRFVASGLAAELGDRRLRSGDALVTGCRILKTEAELARLRRANEATKAALAAAAQRVTVGMDEEECAALVRAAQEAAGLASVWVLALFGEAASFPHGTRARKTLREGELVLVDTGGSLHGYRSDITRTWSIGQPSDAARRAWDATLAAQTAALAVIRPGARCHDVDAAARDVIAKAGFGAGFERFTHRLGHGIGLAVHEAPYLRPGNERVLAPRMTMSNEPGIYAPGSFGVRIEDIVAVTGDGVEVFGPRAASLDQPFGA